MTTKISIDRAALVEIANQLLETIGEDPARPGLVGTPDRFARWWIEFIEYETGNTETTFESITTDQMVVISGLRVWSLCEHHLLPFWVDISIGYIARDRVLGLSKFARIAHKHAHALQIQERLVDDIASDVERLSGSEDVAVLGKGVHLCMLMRGIKTKGTFTTSIMRGCFMEKPEARREFLSLIEQD